MPVYTAVTRIIRDDRVTAVALAPFAVHHRGEDYEVLLDELAEAEVIAALIDLELARVDEHHPHHHWWVTGHRERGRHERRD